MAQVTPLSRSLQLQFQIGTLQNGMPQVQNRTFKYLSPSASDDDILAVGQALAGLFADTLVQVARVDQDGIAAASGLTSA
ncbi:MAG: DUF1659 domain-containing protein [Alicyclobacillus sp.]|nr:DUF1659 domain-containing protein [Alicyclobacillus sp.]